MLIKIIPNFIYYFQPSGDVGQRLDSHQNNMNIRNVAIIAHVDHGKTTLVDALLRQSNTNLGKKMDAKDLIMDSNELERERGITIFSKNYFRFFIDFFQKSSKIVQPSPQIF